MGDKGHRMGVTRMMGGHGMSGVTGVGWGRGDDGMAGHPGWGWWALNPPQAWAQETGRFRAGDPPDPPRWKATLRCALNKSREFRLLVDGPRGSPAQPFRVYELCEEPPGAAGTGGLWETFERP